MTTRKVPYAALALTLVGLGCAETRTDETLEDAGQSALADGSLWPGSSVSDAGIGTTFPPFSGGPLDAAAGFGGGATYDAGGSTGTDASTTRPRDGGGAQPTVDSGPTRPTPDSGTPQPTPDSGTKPSGALWKPKPGTTWQWDLSGAVTVLDVAADVYDIDGFENSAAVVSQLHAAGKKVICYLSVGTYEPDRADAKDFPKEVLGKYWPEWGETYIDIRSEGVRTVMKKRLDMCKSKGFDGIEPDNMDMFEGGSADTGFPLTEADGIAYAKWLADEAHARGMSIGQKNASSITGDIEAFYDWALTEDCFADGWCDDMKPYTQHDKAMFMCEYTDKNIDFAAACTAGKAQKFSPILKKRDLDSSVEFCK